MRVIGDVRMDRPDATLIVDEFRNAAALLTHICRLGCYHHDAASESSDARVNEMRSLIAEHRRLWRSRNREGAFADSAGRPETVIRFYEQVRK